MSAKLTSHYGFCGTRVVLPFQLLAIKRLWVGGGGCEPLGSAADPQALRLQHHRAKDQAGLRLRLPPLRHLPRGTRWPGWARSGNVMEAPLFIKVMPTEALLSVSESKKKKKQH